MVAAVGNLTAKQLAEQELKQEKQTQAVATFKSKLRELDDAHAVVRNLERELEELEAQIGADL